MTNDDDDNDHHDHRSNNSLYQWFINVIQRNIIIIIIVFIISLKLLLFLLFSISIYNYTTSHNGENSYHEIYRQYSNHDVWIKRPQNLRYNL